MRHDVREPASTEPSDLDTALLLLSKLGIRPADLVDAVSAITAAAPTFAEFVPLVAEAPSDGTRKAYGTYWNRIVEMWGDRRLDEPTPLEIEMLGRQLKPVLLSPLSNWAWWGRNIRAADSQSVRTARLTPALGQAMR